MKNLLQKGFTLIEIVIVLIILCILSATAVPKYFDLQEQAREKVAYTISQEYQARLNGDFAEWLLDGKDCEEYVKSKNDKIVEIAIEMNAEGQHLQISEAQSENVMYLDVYFDDTYSKRYPRKIMIPTCKAKSTD